MMSFTVTLTGNTSRTLQEYAQRTQCTLEQIAAEGLADWAETVAEPRLEVLGIHLVRK